MKSILLFAAFLLLTQLGRPWRKPDRQLTDDPSASDKGVLPVLNFY